MSARGPFLQVQKLTKRFGGVGAVSEVSFEVEQGAIVGLIGPNGAGKTTTFNLISGRFPASSGDVRLEGRSLKGLRPDQIAGLGVARTFQGSRIFPNLSVRENVEIASLAGIRVGFWSDLLGRKSAAEAEQQGRRNALDVLDWVGLATFAADRAGSLAYAHQSVLGIAIALALRPRLLLLDEPFAGMNPGETQQAADMVLRIRDRGVTVVLVEHDVPAVMRVCDRIVVLNQGTRIAQGTPAQIRADEQVIEAYLGADADAAG